MKTYFLIIWSLLYFIFSVQIIKNQDNLNNRVANQIYIEDSTHVYWTWYPNPFCPPTITDSTIGIICGFDYFYCDLADTVTVAIARGNDSIIYAKEIISSYPPHFSFCVGVGGPNVKRELLPAQYITSGIDEKLNLFLIVQGKNKNKRHFNIKTGWYYWIHLNS